MGLFDMIQHGAERVGGLVNQGAERVGGLVNQGQQAVNGFLGTPQTHDAANAQPGSPAVAAQPNSLLGGIGQTIGDLGRGFSQEGIGGLLDYRGMLDRQQAQRDLSSRFQVMPDNFVGPRNHNQVSQAEYEQIAHQYSDIRLGRGDLTINTSEMTPGSDQERDYRQGAMNSIADQMMTTGGRRQINNLSNNVLRDDFGNARTDAAGNEQHRHTTIRALYNDTNNDDNLTNDSHTAADYFNGNAFADAAGAHGENGAIDTSGRNSWSRNSTNDERGQGTDSTIWWNPTANVGNCNRSDVILAHEMEHTLHETQGTMARGTYGGPDAVDNGNFANFERQAVGLPTTDATPHLNQRQSTVGMLNRWGLNIPMPGDPHGNSENNYRAERNQLGDNLDTRQHYGGVMPGNRPPPPP